MVFVLFATVTSMDSSPNAQGDSNSPYVTAVQRYFSTMIKVQRGCKTNRFALAT